MDAVVVVDEVKWWETIRRLRGATSRAEISARVRSAGVTSVSEASITKYELGERKPSERAAKALDDALGTGTQIQDACGYFEKRDLELDFAKLRDQVARLEQQVRDQADRFQDQLLTLNATVELLSRTVWPPEPPD